MSRSEVVSAPAWRGLWLAILLGLVLLAGLGQAPLFDVDEGAFSEATREILSSGDWGHTTLNGLDRFDKPIGVYWLQALSALLLGLSEFSMRLPSALAAWISALALAGFVRPRWGERPAVLAAVVHVSSLGPWAMAHAATADALLGLWLMLSALDLWRWLENGSRTALRRLALWVGLGLLTKGPVALLIPLAALCLTALAERRMAPVWQALRDVKSWLVVMGVALPWYAYALWRHGQMFIDGFFLKHNLDRFSAPMEGHAGGFAYFLLLAPVLWLPWSVWLLRWPLAWRSAWQDDLGRRAFIWAAFVVVFFSLSATKLPHYVLYAAPGVALLVVQASRGAGRRWWLLCTLTLLVWHGLMLGLPAWLMAHPERVADPHYRGLLETAPMTPSWAVAALAWLGGGLAWWVLRRRNLLQSRVDTFTWAALLHSLLMGLLVLPWWGQTLQGPVRDLALQSRQWPGTVVQWDLHQPSLGFYRQAPAPRRGPEPGEMALVRTTRLAVPDPQMEELARRGPYALVRRLPPTSPAALEKAP